MDGLSRGLYRRLSAAAIGCAALLFAIVSFAQSPAPASAPAQNAKAQPTPPAANVQAQPPGLEPLPDIAGDTELEPQVTITRREGETVEEARVNGKLVWIKVTPVHGRPYFLVPDAGGYTYIRRESLDTGLKVPLWVLFTF